MPWKPESIDWLGLATAQSTTAAVSQFLSSNPVLNGQVTRPTVYRDLRALFKSAAEVALREFTGMLTNPAPTTSQIVHQVLIDQVTKYLMRAHYLFKLSRPKPPSCRVATGQLWFPASYYVLRGETVFDWKHERPQNDFYESGRGKRHPAVVTEMRTDGLFWVVPLSRSPSGGSSSIAVELRAGTQSYAKCSFPFVASWAMLEGDKDAINREGLRMKTTDFERVRDAAPRYYKLI